MPTSERHYAIPPLSDDPRRPWRERAYTPPDRLDLLALARDIVSDLDGRVLYTGSGSLRRYATCDPETHLWTPVDSIDLDLLTACLAQEAHVRDIHHALRDIHDEISDILDDPIGHGYALAELPLLQADQAEALRATKLAEGVHKTVASLHLGKGKPLLDLVRSTLQQTLTVPPGFNWKTVPITGLPFRNGRLVPSIGVSTTTGETTYGARLTAYSPADHVSVERVIPRDFNLRAAQARQDGLRSYVQQDTETPVRPWGWEWLVRGFLGLPREATPPPTSTPTPDDQIIMDVCQNPDNVYGVDVEDGIRAADRYCYWHGGTHDLLFMDARFVTTTDPRLGAVNLQGTDPAPGSGRTDVLDWFDRMLAATLWSSPAAPFKKIPFIYGASNTGKSTLFNVVHQLIGPLYGHISNSALLQTRSVKDTAQLIASVMGRRFVTPSAEIPANAEWRSEIVKAYVGNDQLLGERKYENAVEFTPEGGLWVAGNHHLSHEDRDDSMSNRLIYITFHQPSGRRLTPAEVSQMIEAEADALLYYLASVHARMLAAADESRDPNYWGHTAFDYPTGYEPDEDELNDETDPYADAFSEVFDVTGDPNDQVPTADLYNAFRLHQIRYGGVHPTRVLTRRMFVTRVLQTRHQIGTKRTSNERFHTGIRLTSLGQSLVVDATTHQP